ncbi:MAG: type II toxin-antitoxin system VapC family toxin [Acidimicrobiia bacterium]
MWAETAPESDTTDEAAPAFRRLAVGFSPLDERDALSDGEAWGRYRRRAGQRRRLVADFLIAAHALHHADRLLTRDRGFYRSYFEDLEVLDPATLSR